MTSDHISVSFVGVYEQIAALIPTIDAEFCKNLFGQPELTITAIGPDGFVIAVNNKPVPVVIVGPQKLVIKAQNKELLFDYLEKMRNKLGSTNNNRSFSAFGINYEYQWLDLEHPTEEWMWNKFIDKDISIEGTYCVCPKISLRVVLNETQWINLSFSQRIGRNDGLYADINHHHNIRLEGLPQRSEFINYYNESEDKVINNVLPQVLKQNGNE